MPASRDTNRTTLRQIVLHTDNHGHTGILRQTVRLDHRHNKLGIMSEPYSCRKPAQTRFHLHTALYPSNTYEKERFGFLRGAFCDRREATQTLVLIWNNPAAPELRPEEFCSAHLLKTFVSRSQSNLWQSKFVKTHSLPHTPRLQPRCSCLQKCCNSYIINDLNRCT